MHSCITIPRSYGCRREGPHTITAGTKTAGTKTAGIKTHGGDGKRDALAACECSHQLLVPRFVQFFWCNAANRSHASMTETTARDVLHTLPNASVSRCHGLTKRLLAVTKYRHQTCPKGSKRCEKPVLRHASMPYPQPHEMKQCHQMQS